MDDPLQMTIQEQIAAAIANLEVKILQSQAEAISNLVTKEAQTEAIANLEEKISVSRKQLEMIAKREFATRVEKCVRRFGKKVFRVSSL